MLEENKKQMLQELPPLPEIPSGLPPWVEGAARQGVKFEGDVPMENMDPFVAIPEDKGLLVRKLEELFGAKPKDMTWADVLEKEIKKRKMSSEAQSSNAQEGNNSEGLSTEIPERLTEPQREHLHHRWAPATAE